MNKDKVYIEGYEVGFLVDITGAREKKIKVASGEIVSIDERFIYKSIEREKVKVPQYVADEIEYAKRSDWDLEDTFQDIAGNDNSSDIYQWYYSNSDNMDIFARAWLDGYEVEEEKRYYVRFKWIEDSYSYLTLIKHLHAWTLSDIKLDKKFRIAHTRKELEEAGFGWVFDCEGIEIEEVE